MELKTLQYFSHNLTDPIHEVFQVLYNPNHSEYNKLLHDMKSINAEELSLFVIEKQIDFYIKDSFNIDIERRAWFLINRLHRDIASKRLDELSGNGVRLNPYNSLNLKEILINDENLVDISFFDLKPIGIVHNNFGYRLCPSTNLDNSTYWLFLEIIKLVLKNKKKFYIRLDPFIEIPIKDYTPMAYKMTIHGKPLNWDRIRNLQNDDFGQFINEKEDSDYSITDYVWNVKKNEIHFTCEELPAIGNCTIRGSRYFHAIFNKDTGSIIHCDGAIRIYSESELADRMRFHVRSSDVRKVGKRVKIFQTNDSLTQEEFSHLVMSFFVWNQDVVSYFNT